MLNYNKLVGQGRAKAIGQPWTAEELEALITLERERKLHRTIAADYIRNGILTVEDYDEAKKKDFKPLNEEEASVKASDDLKKRGEKVVKKDKSKKKKDEK